MHVFKAVIMITIVYLLAIGAGWMVEPQAQMSQTGMGKVAGGGSGGTCTGTIDLSEGCVLPMVGGAP